MHLSSIDQIHQRLLTPVWLLAGPCTPHTRLPSSINVATRQKFQRNNIIPDQLGTLASPSCTPHNTPQNKLINFHHTLTSLRLLDDRLTVLRRSRASHPSLFSYSGM